MDSVLKEATNDINNRLAELAPLVAEYNELLAAAEALDAVQATPAKAKSKTPRKKAHYILTPANGDAPRRGRPKGNKNKIATPAIDPGA